MAQGSLARPGATRGNGTDKALSRLVAKHVRKVSYYLPDDDFEQMIATRLKCNNIADMYAKPRISLEEVVGLIMTVSILPNLPSAEALPFLRQS